MIEILFGESEAASMKAAKCEQIYVSSNDGPTACFGAGKRKVPEKKDYSWIEGNSTEVVCLGFLLDIGDIQKRDYWKLSQESASIALQSKSVGWRGQLRIRITGNV